VGAVFLSRDGLPLSPGGKPPRDYRTCHLVADSEQRYLLLYATNG
jgi:hypothetical protein